MTPRYGVFFLFALSGATGLAYEIIWFKRFSLVWGNSALAQAAVVASFLLGLALGARLIGGYADRVRQPLFWYGIAEIGIGIFAWLVPFEAAGLARWTASSFAALAAHPLGLSLARCGLTFLVIGPPCVLMGGTLPLLVRWFATNGGVGRCDSAVSGPLQTDNPVGNATGWFYAVNTLGAAAGCYLAGFVVLPRAGMVWSNLGAVALNLVVGVIAICLARNESRSTKTPASPSATAPTAGSERELGIAFPPSWAVFLAAGATGCAALMLQTVWTRQLALIVGGSTYAFSAMLCVFLLGIGAGSLAFERWLSGSADRLKIATLTIWLIAVGTLVGQRLIPSLTIASGLVVPLRHNPALNDGFCLAVSALIELMPTLGMGALLPMLVSLVAPAPDRAGEAPAEAGHIVGTVYAANTLGAILGAIVTPLVLVPKLGATLSVGCAAALYLAAGLLLVAHRTMRDAFWAWHVVVSATVLFFARTPLDPLQTNFGMYLYGYQSSGSSRAQVLSFQEGVSCNVLVLKDGEHRSLRVNGKVDASSSGDMQTQLGLAYFPRFLRPAAKDVLVIGFGSGTSSGASLLFPETKVTCCEIEPAVVAASRHFAEVNHRPEQSPNFTTQLDDARSFLQGTPRKYDLMISEPSNPWIRDVSSLFTREFIQTAKSRLRPDGVWVQWIQAYSLSASDFAMIVRTVTQAFRHYHLYWINAYDTVLMASDSPIGFEKNRLQAAQSLADGSPSIQADLQKHFATTDAATLLLTHHILDEEGLRKLAEQDGSPIINTDENLQLEFNAPRRMFGGTDAAEVVRLILNSVRPQWYKEAFAQLPSPEKQVSAYRSLSALFSSNGQTNLALEIVRNGRQFAPNEPKLLSEELILSSETDMEAIRSMVSKIAALSDAEASRVGVGLWKQKKHHQAVGVFELLAAKNPKSPTTWFNLAVNYKELGEKRKAREAYEKGIALDPLNANLLEFGQAMESKAASK